MKKMRFGKSCFAAVMFVVFAMILTGCIGGTSKPSKFYLLRSMDDSQKSLPPAGNKDSVSVLVGPISLPAYLDRTQMVTVAGTHQLTLHEFNRWSESLRDSFYRVLQEDLSTLLGTPDVYRYDQSETSAADYQVVIYVTRFDAVSEGDAVLRAFWTLTRKEADTPGVTRKSVFRRPVSGMGFPGIVNVQNQTINEFSREIATAIKSAQD